MTAPGPVLSPTAGLFNTLVAYLNDRLAARVAELLLLIDVEIEYGHEYRTARDYADSAAAGYVTPLEEV